MIIGIRCKTSCETQQPRLRRKCLVLPSSQVITSDQQRHSLGWEDVLASNKLDKCEGLSSDPQLSTNTKIQDDDACLTLQHWMWMPGAGLWRCGQPEWTHDPNPDDKAMG